MLHRLVVLTAVAFTAHLAVRANAAPTTQSIEGIGRVIDQDDDCDITGDAQHLTIKIPDTPHDFAAELERWNAPRVTSKVTGDFDVEAKITGEFSPQDPSTIDGRKAYNGAGILATADGDTHLSVQRAAFRDGDHLRHYLNFEVRERGKVTISRYNIDLQDDDVWIRLARRGNKLTASFSPDGATWRGYQPVKVHLPQQLEVGIEAINSSNAEFQCTFENYKLTRATTSTTHESEK